MLSLHWLFLGDMCFLSNLESEKRFFPGGIKIFIVSLLGIDSAGRKELGERLEFGTLNIETCRNFNHDSREKSYLLSMLGKILRSQY